MVQPMLRTVWVAALAACVMMAEGCGRKPVEVEAAGPAQALLTAAWTGDAKAFEAGLDRIAVRHDLRQQLLQVAQANTLAVEGGASDAALDRMITPDSFKLVEAGAGAPLSGAPSPGQTVALMKPLGKDRACLHDVTPQKSCVLTFAKEAAGWRLVAMRPAGFNLEIGPEPVKSGS